MRFEVTYRGRFTTGTDEEIEAAFDGTMRELVNLGVHDASVTGSAATGEVEISGMFEGGTHVAALTAADVTFRSALRAAGVLAALEIQAVEAAA